MEKYFHPYHMVTMSPWPLMIGFGVLGVMVGMVKMFVFSEMNLLKMSFFL